jgi:PAS domain-containing protein
MNVLDQAHPDDLLHVLEETEKAISAEDVVRNKAEYRFHHKDGSWRRMESMGTYILDDPAVGGVVVTSRDVTERRETEEKLHALCREYEELVGSVGENIWEGEAQALRFTFVSDQVEANPGLPGAALDGGTPVLAQPHQQRRLPLLRSGSQGTGRQQLPRAHP